MALQDDIDAIKTSIAAAESAEEIQAGSLRKRNARLDLLYKRLDELELRAARQSAGRSRVLIKDGNP